MIETQIKINDMGKLPNGDYFVNKSFGRLQPLWGVETTQKNAEELFEICFVFLCVLTKDDEHIQNQAATTTCSLHFYLSKDCDIEPNPGTPSNGVQANIAVGTVCSLSDSAFQGCLISIVVSSDK